MVAPYSGELGLFGSTTFAASCMGRVHSNGFLVRGRARIYAVLKRVGSDGKTCWPGQLQWRL